MIKVIGLVTRNPKVSPEEFRRYWEEVHVPLIHSMLPGLVKYIGSFRLNPEGGVDPATEIVGCDLVIELGFPDLETMQRDFSSDAYLYGKRTESGAYFMDLASIRSVLVEEVDVSDARSARR